MTTLAYLSPYLSEIHQFHGNSNFMNALTTTYVILFFSILSKISISSIIKLCNFSRMIKVCLTRIYRINPVIQTNFSIRQFWTFSKSVKNRNEYYKVLGVSRDAPKQEIKEAYLKLSKSLHPDINKSQNASRISESQRSFW